MVGISYHLVLFLYPLDPMQQVNNLHVSFHQVHKTDCGRVRYKKVCEKDGEELKPDDIIKAYIVGGECLKFTDEELDALKPFSTKIMEILGFCKIDRNSC